MMGKAASNSPKGELAAAPTVMALATKFFYHVMWPPKWSNVPLEILAHSVCNWDGHPTCWITTSHKLHDIWVWGFYLTESASRHFCGSPRGWPAPICGSHFVHSDESTWWLNERGSPGCHFCACSSGSRRAFVQLQALFASNRPLKSTGCHFWGYWSASCDCSSKCILQCWFHQAHSIPGCGLL